MMRIADIQIGERYRQDMGDIEGLARSISEIGLLHPVVVASSGLLIAGQRRIAACLMLGWTDIPARIVDLESIVQGELAENTIRKDFTPSEAVAIGKAIEPLEREAADNRQSATQGNRQTGAEKFSEPERGRALDKVAEHVGMSRPTYTPESFTGVSLDKVAGRRGARVHRWLFDHLGAVFPCYVGQYVL
jgi:ParB family transcriptional regulator, chromosome partitioning protein